MKRDTYLLAAAKELDGFEGIPLNTWLNKRERQICAALYRKRGLPPPSAKVGKLRSILKSFASTGRLRTGKPLQSSMKPVTDRIAELESKAIRTSDDNLELAELHARKRFRRKAADVNSAEFLETYAWRRCRYEALKKHGARCQCCGRGATEGVALHVDHIKPRRKYPDLALDVNNLQVLCSECNHGKGNWDTTDWRGNGHSSQHPD